MSYLCSFEILNFSSRLRIPFYSTILLLNYNVEYLYSTILWNVSTQSWGTIIQKLSLKHLIYREVSSTHFKSLNCVKEYCQTCGRTKGWQKVIRFCPIAAILRYILLDSWICFLFLSIWPPSFSSSVGASWEQLVMILQHSNYLFAELTLLLSRSCII